MKNYNVKAIINFDDIEEKVQRKQNDIFKITKERYLYLKEHKAVELIGIDKIEKKETKETKTKK